MTSRIAATASVFCLLGAGVASAQTPHQQVVEACKGDVERLCPNVPAGHGEVMKCLKAQKQQVSFGCKRALYDAKQEHAAQAAQSAPPH